VYRYCVIIVLVVHLPPGSPSGEMQRGKDRKATKKTWFEV
jgi:hypothetical protein